MSRFTIVILLVICLDYSMADNCAKEGEKCGGETGLSCCASTDPLRCVSASGDNGSEVSICRNNCKKEGEMCGGFAGFVCCSGQGLTCDAPKQCCDMAGKCVKKT